MSADTGGPAFPGPYATESGAIEVLWKQQGMTLRDYFAAKAMQAMLNDAEVFWAGAAPLAYQYADAMLKAREQ